MSRKAESFSSGSSDAAEMERVGTFCAMPNGPFTTSWCTPGRIGFWTFEDHIRLDRGDRCGTLSGDPLVDRINGLSIFGGMQAVFESVETACRNDEPIQIGIFNSAESLSAECTEPLSMLPPSATLTVGDRN